MSTFLGCFHSVRGALTVSKASAGTSCVGHWATVFATRAGTLQLRNSSSDGGNTTDSEETVSVPDAIRRDPVGRAYLQLGVCPR
eukprot:scaffold1146_cov399-Prasinococcus_capsulatus_cf.AAC.71